MCFKLSDLSCTIVGIPSNPRVPSTYSHLVAVGTRFLPNTSIHCDRNDGRQTVQLQHNVGVLHNRGSPTIVHCAFACVANRSWRTCSCRDLNIWSHSSHRDASRKQKPMNHRRRNHVVASATRRVFNSSTRYNLSSSQTTPSAQRHRTPWRRRIRDLVCDRGARAFVKKSA